MEPGHAIDLDAVDGFEFEKVCKEILERLSYGRVEDVVDVGDEGRDLLVHTARGLLVVECKHHPGSSIGRPVVQKLHSAVVTARGIGGILITTGRFSKAALDYADRLRRDGMPIDMVDRSILTDMARRAGLELFLGGARASILTYAISEDTRLAHIVGAHLDRHVIGHPHAPSRLLQLGVRRVTLIPAYTVRYNVDAMFETTVGVIHREHASGGCLFLDGRTGDMLIPELRDFFAATPAQEFDPSRASGAQEPAQKFTLDQVSLRGVARGHITRLHTRTVTYYGKNNQRYTKVCTPGERDIVLIDVRQVYLPVTSAEVRLLNTGYQVRFLEDPSGLFKPLDQKLSTCLMCSRPIKEGRVVCNACGAITHSAQFWKSHSFVCRDCGRTVCRRCAVYVRSFLVLRRSLCRNCSIGTRYRTKEVRAFPELSRESQNRLLSIPC